MATGQTSVYTRTYTSFSGADIVATFDGFVIGELQAITYSVTREKAPIYTMGSANPRSFSRGKRGIAGSIVFTVFDGDALKKLKERATFKGYKENRQVLSVGEWDSAMSSRVANNQLSADNLNAMYADEIYPFDITITFRNEYGQQARMSLLGVEILNEGQGMSIDDVTTEKACTFVAREITHMEVLQ